MSAQAKIIIDATPVEVDLKLYQGDDFRLVITVLKGDGTAADLTGQTAAAQIATTTNIPPVASFDATVTLPNLVDLHLNASDAALLQGNMVWDCQISGGDTTTLCFGKVTVMAQVTAI